MKLRTRISITLDSFRETWSLRYAIGTWANTHPSQNIG